MSCRTVSAGAHDAAAADALALARFLRPGASMPTVANCLRALIDAETVTVANCKSLAAQVAGSLALLPDGDGLRIHPAFLTDGLPETEARQVHELGAAIRSVRVLLASIRALAEDTANAVSAEAKEAGVMLHGVDASELMTLHQQMGGAA